MSCASRTTVNGFPISDAERHRFAIKQNMNSICTTLGQAHHHEFVMQNLVTQNEWQTVTRDTVDVTDPARTMRIMHYMMNRSGYWDKLLGILEANGFSQLQTDLIDAANNYSCEDIPMQLETNGSSQLQNDLVDAENNFSYNEIPVKRNKKNRLFKIVCGCVALLAAITIIVVPTCVVLLSNSSDNSTSEVDTTVLTSVSAAASTATSGIHTSTSAMNSTVSTCEDPTISLGSVIAFPCTTEGPTVCPCSTTYCKLSGSSNGGYCNCLFGGADCQTNGDCCNYACVNKQCQIHGGDKGSICVSSDVSGDRISGCKVGCECVDYFFDDSVANGKGDRGYCSCTVSK